MILENVVNKNDKEVIGVIMYAQVNIKYKQDIAKEEVPLFRSATQEKLDEVISKYKQNVIETIEDEFEGKLIL